MDDVGSNPRNGGARPPAGGEGCTNALPRYPVEIDGPLWGPHAEHAGRCPDIRHVRGDHEDLVARVGLRFSEGADRGSVAANQVGELLDDVEDAHPGRTAPPAHKPCFGRGRHLIARPALWREAPVDPIYLCKTGIEYLHVRRVQELRLCGRRHRTHWFPWKELDARDEVSVDRDEINAPDS